MDVQMEDAQTESEKSAEISQDHVSACLTSRVPTNAASFAASTTATTRGEATAAQGGEGERDKKRQEATCVASQEPVEQTLYSAALPINKSGGSQEPDFNATAHDGYAEGNPTPHPYAIESPRVGAAEWPHTHGGQAAERQGGMPHPV